jgi:hypothetical protein
MASLNVDQFIWSPEVGEMAATWFNNRYRSQKAPDTRRKNMLTDEKKDTIRKAAEAVLDARVESLANWLKAPDYLQTALDRLGEVAQILGILKTLDGTPAAPSPSWTLRQYALANGYAYCLSHDDLGRLMVEIKRTRAGKYSAVSGYGVDEDAAAKVVLELAGVGKV